MESFLQDRRQRWSASGPKMLFMDASDRPCWSAILTYLTLKLPQVTEMTDVWRTVCQAGLCNFVNDWISTSVKRRADRHVAAQSQRPVHDVSNAASLDDWTSLDWCVQSCWQLIAVHRSHRSWRTSAAAAAVAVVIVLAVVIPVLESSRKLTLFFKATHGRTVALNRPTFSPLSTSRDYVVRRQIQAGKSNLYYEEVGSFRY